MPRETLVPCQASDAIGYQQGFPRKEEERKEGNSELD